MNVCTSTHGPIPALRFLNRLGAVFGVICIAAAVVSGALAGGAAVMHLDGRLALRVAHAPAQPDLRATADDDYVQLLTAIGSDDYVQLLPRIGNAPARPTGDF
jgi:hypothetical protein